MPHPYSLTNVFGRVLDVFCAHKSQMARFEHTCSFHTCLWVGIKAPFFYQAAFFMPLAICPLAGRRHLPYGPRRIVAMFRRACCVS